jgi:hypothetical protein
MRTLAVLVVATLAMGATACGGRTRPAFAPGSPALTSATITFFNRDDGKDARSTATVELIRNTSELGAEARAVGTHFEHDTTTAPISLSLTSRFTKDDVSDSRLRLRLTPDGRDIWTFNARLTLMFADGSVQNFAWTNVRLDNDSPERTLMLSSARMP